MRLFAFAIALLTACSACGTTSSNLTGPAPTMSDPAVAKLLVNDEGSCTMWKTTDDLVVTAGHCCDVGTVYGGHGSHVIPGSIFTVLVDDDVHDVCVLHGKMIGKPITIAMYDPQVGERIWSAGFPRGKFLISDGFWSGRDEGDRGICSSVVGFGASGSPILNLQGESVGVLIKRFGDMDNLTFVAPIEWVKRAIFKARLMPAASES